MAVLELKAIALSNRFMRLNATESMHLKVLLSETLPIPHLELSVLGICKLQSDISIECCKFLFMRHQAVKLLRPSTWITSDIKIDEMVE